MAAESCSIVSSWYSDE